MLRNNEIKANAVDFKEKDKQLLCSCGQNTQHVPYIKPFSQKFVIIHVWSLLVEVFFEGVHLEFEKKPIHIYYPFWIIHFIGCVSAKYVLPPPFPN